MIRDEGTSKIVPAQRFSKVSRTADRNGEDGRISEASGRPATAVRSEQINGRRNATARKITDLSLEKVFCSKQATHGAAVLIKREVLRAFSRPGSDLLSRVLRRSTIGAGAFHGRVRNGIGCSRSAITTRSAKRT